MNIEEIKQNIYPEDKMMVAVTLETSYFTINAMLRGSRNIDTDLGKSILAELTRIAKINRSAKRAKVSLAKSK